MARLYTNENFPVPVVLELRRLGHDVLTSHEAGSSNQRIPDEEVLAFASQTGRRVVVTLNRKHFVRLHARDKAHGGILVCTVDPDVVGLARRIHDAVTACPDLTGTPIRVNRPA